MKFIDLVEKEVTKTKLPDFRAGDTLKVYVRVKEGDKTRTQLFEGVCIGRRGRGAGASFGVVKETHGDVVEKTFPLHSPTIEKIVVSRKGKFTRSKLYHLKKK